MLLAPQVHYLGCYRGKEPRYPSRERYTLDGKIPIEDQSESLIMKITGLKFLVENPKAPFVWFAIAMGVIFYIAGF